MPFQNRVTPYGDLVAVPERGTLTGNRGVLHDADGAIVRWSQVRRWITCVLEFRDWHRTVMAPNRYTHLFFLDEATALVAGHRPCAECRWADYQRFRRLWAVAAESTEPPGADAMDVALHRERARVGGRRRTEPRPAAALPDGAFVEQDDAAWLVLGGDLLRWTPGGYTDHRPLPAGMVPVLTPPSTVGVLGAGYRPALHPTASRVR